MMANVRIERTDPHRPGLGSGVVIQRSGDDAFILTNRHVVDGNYALLHLPTPLEIIPPLTIGYLTKERHTGTVVWVASDDIDMAIVRAPCPNEIEAVPWNSAANARIGEPVFAIGNPVTLGWTFSRGIVSQIRSQKSGSRDVPIIQTDASLSPGSSGGGLYNAAGELIGLNSAIVAPFLGGRLGFAIRTDILRELKPEVLELPASDNE
jgi:S1-C subfamily serine protease